MEEQDEEERGMAGKTYEPEKDNEILRKVVAQYYERADALATWLTDQGKRLVADFRGARMALRADAKAELAAAAAGP